MAEWKQYAARLSGHRQDVLARVERIGGELSIDYAPKGRSTWLAKFPDTNGWYNVYKCKQDRLSMQWLFDIGMAEGKPWASRAHAAAMEIVERETAS